MARLIPEAKHNATSIARCAWLASKFGYHTGSIFRIAQHASRSEFERPELATLAELAVRKLSETQRMVQLAESATGLLTAEEQEQLTEEIARLDASADFSTLDEALEWQAAQGWASLEAQANEGTELCGEIYRLSRERGWRMTELKEKPFTLEETFLSLTEAETPVAQKGGAA